MRIDRLQTESLTDRLHTVVAWHSGSALVSINVVTLRRARLVLGWVTVCGRVNHLDRAYVTSHLGQLSLLSLRGR